MKNTKHIFSFLSMITLVGGMQAQIVYTDLSPDDEHAMPVGSGTTIPFDVDGDNVDDFEFSYTNYPSFGIWNLGIVPIDPNSPTTDIVIDMSVPKSQIGDFYVMALSKDDEVSANSDYANDYPQIGDIYNGNMHGQTGKYIGFRIKAGNDYKYGWMALEFSGPDDLKLVISEFAYEDTPGKSIKAGQKQSTVGIEQLNLTAGGFNFFPNPTSTKLTINNTNATAVQLINIYSIQGSLVKQLFTPAFPMNIATDDWDSGAYFIEVVAEGKVYRDRVIKL